MLQIGKENSGAGHPPAHQLDAVAAGDDVPRVTAHLLSCAACARYVEALRAGAASFRAASDAGSFVARVRAHSGRRRWAERRAHAGWVIAPLCAAAGLFFLLRGQPVLAPPVDSIEPTMPPVVGETHFKGGLSVAVIRERDGQQGRLAGPIRVRAGDRLRIELGTDREQPLTAGLLTDDGAWVPLLSPVTLATGTHYSERAAVFDETATKATLLVGAPDAVEQARRTRDFRGLLAWRVTSEP